MCDVGVSGRRQIGQLSLGPPGAAWGGEVKRISQKPWRNAFLRYGSGLSAEPTALDLHENKLASKNKNPIISLFKSSVALYPPLDFWFVAFYVSVLVL